MRQRVAAAVVGGVMLSGCGAAEPRIIELYGEPSSRLVEAVVNTCDQHPRLLAEESTDQVIVTLIVNDLDFSRGECSDAAVVTLVDPLGERAVIDGATEEPLNVLPAESAPRMR
ncbi:MAG: hypothetical protein WBG89_13890 [Ornithinimicrobium sp.]